MKIQHLVLGVLAYFSYKLFQKKETIEPQNQPTIAQIEKKESVLGDASGGDAGYLQYANAVRPGEPVPVAVAPITQPSATPPILLKRPNKFYDVP